MNISAIAAFNDNYIWLLLSQDGQYAVVVDPGDAEPVFTQLKQHHVKLAAILITHHHHDHIGGVAELATATGARVYGPAREARKVVRHPLSEGDTVEIDEIGASYRVLDIPGHTMGHIAYVGHNQLYCGDTLFAAGCGRVFEGTNAQMLDSLNKLACLPDDTAVYCGHEYTQANLNFAATVEPNNPDIQARLATVKAMRAKQLNTLPSQIGLEKATNPFLRCELDSVKQAAEQYAGQKLETSVDVFGIVRSWKNEF